LVIALVARYIRHLTGAWRWIYAVNVVISLYLNVFVLIAQLFQKIPALKAVAPTQSEPPFLITQLVVMALFIVLGIFAVKRFHVERLGTAEAFG
jgi:MFS family permease